MVDNRDDNGGDGAVGDYLQEKKCEHELSINFSCGCQRCVKSFSCCLCLFVCVNVCGGNKMFLQHFYNKGHTHIHTNNLVEGSWR